MCDEKGADLLRLMSGEIVDDDVDFASPWLRLDDGREEGDKLIARMARRGAVKSSAEVNSSPVFAKVRQSSPALLSTLLSKCPLYLFMWRASPSGSLTS